MSKLKECPICGEGGGWITSQESSEGKSLIVGCKHCSCQVRVPITHPEYGTKLWNTRQPRFTEAQREAIESVCKLAEAGRLERYREEEYWDGKQIALRNHMLATTAIDAIRAMLKGE